MFFVGGCMTARRSILVLVSTFALALAGPGGCGGGGSPPSGTAGAPAPTPPSGGSGGTGGGGIPAAGPDGSALPAPPPAPSPAAGPLTSYKTCSDETRVADFELGLRSGFTGIEPATVFDAVDTNTLARVVREVGGCKIIQPPLAVPPCSPECQTSTQICTATGCKPRPAGQDVGTVTIDGLKAPGTLNKSPDHVYTNPSWPHPGFDEGATLVLRASGAGNNPAFSVRGWGVGPLVVPADKLPVENGKPATLTWTPPTRQGPTRMLISLSINRHGSVDTSLECEVPDTGSFTIDAAAITEVFKYGVSGFPSVDMKRQSADTATLRAGCLEFNVVASASREIAVPGVISCVGEPEPGQPDPCPPGQTCGEDLRCH
jgi:hypothetical protein